MPAKRHFFLLRHTVAWIALATAATISPGFAQTPPDKLADVEKQIETLARTVAEMRQEQTNSLSRTNDVEARSVGTNTPAGKIREEGLHHSQVMSTLSYLSDVIGPRLTGSPGLKRANEWTRDTMASWGLTNAHLEPWGPFGRGWSLKRFSAQIVEPQTIVLAAYPKAWSPGLAGTVTADVVLLEAKTEADLEKYKGKVQGSIVLSGSTRELMAHFEPQARRLEATNLLELADMDPGASAGPGSSRGRTGGRGGPRAGGGRGGASPALQSKVLAFLVKEGATAVITPSAQGDGGTIFVSQASLPGADTTRTNSTGTRPRLSPWSTNAPATPPQIAMATEDYNRLARMIKQGEKLKMTLDLQVLYYDDDLMAYNTIAEIPGGDLKEQVVMLGGHLDSWHSGTGATDNGAGVAAAMEAVRIIEAAKLRPRRTIRVALWTGEEQGLLGSKAYVAQHFGHYTNAAPATSSGGGDAPGNDSDADRKLVREPDYDQFSAYFNLDNGAGKIRGVYMQGDEAVRPLFRKWLRPFADLGAETLTPSNTGSTDHVSFDTIGLPGFQFIQDPLEYMSRSHHSNADVYDRISEDDMKQASTVLAAFVYNAAMLDEKIPRKPAQ